MLSAVIDFPGGSKFLHSCGVTIRLPLSLRFLGFSPYFKIILWFRVLLALSLKLVLHNLHLDGSDSFPFLEHSQMWQSFSGMHFRQMAHRKKHEVSYQCCFYKGREEDRERQKGRLQPAQLFHRHSFYLFPWWQSLTFLPLKSDINISNLTSLRSNSKTNLKCSVDFLEIVLEWINMYTYIIHTGISIFSPGLWSPS